MKIAFTILIVCGCGIVGYMFKKNLKDKVDFLNYIKSYVDYCHHNISIFNNNLIETTDSYLISIKNKNAKNYNIFVKSNQLYMIDENILKIFINDKSEFDIIYSYLCSMGKRNIESVEQSYKTFSSYLYQKIKETKIKSDSDGELYFKISLAIGAVISIIMW